jgi:hypothetical protein
VPKGRWVNFAKPHRDTRLDSGQPTVVCRVMSKGCAAPVNGVRPLKKTCVLKLFNDWP